MQICSKISSSVLFHVPNCDNERVDDRPDRKRDASAAILD